MPAVRVYILTCRRNHLLPRAVASLRAQTFTDWICELHNDAPEDSFPGELVARTGDARIRMFNHAANLGATRTFNLVFQPCAEEFVCLLEDDNWWQPDFLATMVPLLRNHPSAQVAWANMRIWQARTDGGWNDTGRTIWPEADFISPTWFNWPHPRSLAKPVHSNGAALFRNRDLSDLVLPAETPFFIMESLRDRALQFPLLFFPRPLVNFAWTISTHREQDPVLAAQMNGLLVATYLANARLTSVEFGRLVELARRAPRNELGGLFVAAMLAGCGLAFARHVRVREWPWLVATLLRHGRTNLAVLQARSRWRGLWDFVDHHTAKRIAIMAANATAATSN